MQEKTKEELEVEVNFWRSEYEEARKQIRELASNLRQTSSLLLEFQTTPRLNLKQEIMLHLIRSVPLTAPGYFNAHEQWERAEFLYEVGVERGHFPK